MLNSQTSTNDAPLLTAAIGFVSVLALPLVFLLVFTVWGESLARQIVAGFAVLTLVSFTLVRQKFELLLVALIFFTQFSISLHTFALAEPVLLQVFFSDILILLFLWAAVERRESWSLDWVGWLFVAYIGWLAIAAYYSAHLHQSLLFIVWQVKYLLLYVLVRNAPLSERFVRMLTYAVCAVLVLQTAISLAQLKQGHWIGLSILGEPQVENLKDYLVSGSLRVSGTFGVTNAFGGYVGALLILLTPFALTRLNGVVALAIGVGLVSLIACLSRAAWLSFVVGAAAVVILLLRARLVSFTRVALLSLLGVVTLTAGVAVYYNKIINRFEDRQAISSAHGRLAQFTEAWAVVTQYPKVGIGPGVTEFFGRWHKHKRFLRQALPGITMANQVHSSQLQMWIESGYVGLLLFLGLMLATAWTLRTSVLSIAEEPLDVSLLRIGAAGGALALMVHASFGTEINHHQFVSLFWMLLALARRKSTLASATYPASTQSEASFMSARLVT